MELTEAPGLLPNTVPRATMRSPREPLGLWSRALCQGQMKVRIRLHLSKSLVTVRKEVDAWRRPPHPETSADRGYVGAEA